MTRTALLLSLLVAACGPSSTSGDDSGGSGGVDAAGTGGDCTGTQTRCVGSSYQQCEDGQFVEVEACMPGSFCAPSVGCVECDPDTPRTCVGDSVHVCNPDGTVGEQLEDCGFENCSGGVCGGGDDCASGAELVYLVDDSNTLYSFDPSVLPADPFAIIGNLSCPAGPSFPEIDPFGGTATPFSMSVDRNATAWVLYSSGEIFEVSTDNASCAATTFQVGQQGFQLFGMGFVSDTPGSSDETLYIAGGAATLMGAGDLGTIAMGSMAVGRVGSLASAENSPELTGTGDAELFGYFPGATSTVAQLDKTTGGTVQTWNLPGLTGQVRAWAFAHWGGKFYIFITTTDLLGIDTEANVLELDPVTGNTTQVLTDTGKIIVGAGVSTCAPVVVE